MAIMIDFGIALSNCRKNREMTRAELADESGIGVDMLSRWEKDRELPESTGPILILAAALNIDRYMLLTPLMNDVQRRIKFEDWINLHAGA